jgi:hypothetical protein
LISASDPSISFSVNPGALWGVAPGDTVPVQVWAIVMIDSTSTSTRLYAACGTNIANPRYVAEYGSSGVSVATPSSGSTKMRHVFLGTLLMDAGSGPDAQQTIWIGCSRAAGAAFSIDEIMLVPADNVLVSPFGDDPANIPIASGYTQRIAHDGSGMVYASGVNGEGFTVSDVGLTGSDLVLMPGQEHFFWVHGGTLVPNAPTGVSSSETNGGIDQSYHVIVQPRVVIGGE